jgi:predicted AAA+ superfamily ATPase
MSSKKRKSEPGCIATIFGYTILACIVFTIFNLAKTHLSTKAKIIILSVIGILLILKIFGFFNRKYTMSQLDNMEGHRFEFACADILKMNGFYDVKVTQGSGDYGVDIIARKGMRKYAIQCKCYSHKLDNKPIQEVIGGLAYYGCNKGVVMTNQYFTEPAKQLAKVNGTEMFCLV